MTFEPPGQVLALKSSAELMSWALGAFAPREGDGSIKAIQQYDKRFSRQSTFWVGGQRGAYRGDVIDYGGCPTHVHGYWFARMNLFGTKDLAGISALARGDKTAKNKFSLATKASDLFFEGQLTLFDQVCAGASVPDEVQEWLRSQLRGTGKPAIRFDGATGFIEFSRQRVMEGVEVIRSHPSDDLSLAVLGSIGSRTARPISSGLTGSTARSHESSPSEVAILGAGVLGGAPLYPTAFDRRDELLRLQSAIQDLLATATRSKKILQVVGEGGLGKSALVSDYVGGFARTDFPDGVYWLDIAGSVDVTTAIQRLCKQVDPSLSSHSVLETSRYLADKLATKRILVVLDGAATLEQLSALSIVGQHGATVITTRRPIAGISSLVFRPKKIDDAEARDYVESIVGGHSREDLVTRLVETCDGSPLALRLAVSAVQSAPDLEQVVHMLERDDYGDHEFANVFTSLAAVLATARPNARAAYLRLAVFPAGVPIPVDVIEKYWTRLAPAAAQDYRASDLVAAGLAGEARDHTSLVISDLVKASLEAHLENNVSLLHGELLRLHLGDADLEHLWEMPEENRYIWETLPYHLRGAGHYLSPFLTHPGCVAKSIAVRGVSAVLRDLTIASSEPIAAAGIAAVLIKSLSQLSDLFDPHASWRDILETLWFWSAQFGLWKSDNLFAEAGATGELVPVGQLPVVPDGQTAVIDAGARWILTVAWIAEDLLATAGVDGQIRVIDIRTGSELFTSPELGTSVLCLAANANTIVAGLVDGRAIEWIPGDALITEHQVHNGAVRSIAVDVGNECMLTAGDDGIVRRWSLDWTTSYVIGRFEGRSVTCLCVFRRGHHWIAGCADGLVAAYPAPLMDGTEVEWRAIATLDSSVVGLVDQGEDTLHAASMDGERVTLNIGSGAKTAVHRSPCGLTGLDQVRNGFLVSTNERGQIEVSDLTRSVVREARSNIGWSRAVAVRPAGDFAASAGDDGVVRIWDVPMLMASRVPMEEFTHVALSHDGSLLAAANSQTQVTLFSRPAGLEWRQVVRTHEQMVCALAVNSNSLAITTRTGRVDLWISVLDGWVSRPAAHSDWPRACAFSPEGEYLVTAGDDGHVNIWSVTESMQLLGSGTFAGHRLRAIAWNGETEFLIGGSGGRLWHFCREGDAWNIAGEWALGGAGVRSVEWNADVTCVLIGRADGSVDQYPWDRGALGGGKQLLAPGLARIRIAHYVDNGNAVLAAYANGSVSLVSPNRPTNLVRVATHLRSVTASSAEDGLIFVGTRGFGEVRRRTG